MAWEKGQSGNPTGAGAGRKKMSPEMRAALDDYGIEGITALIHLARTAEKESDRITCINSLLDRGYGKAVQAIEAEVTERRPILYDSVYDEAAPKAN